jgi:hypothetical protein
MSNAPPSIASLTEVYRAYIGPIVKENQMMLEGKLFQAVASI